MTIERSSLMAYLAEQDSSLRKKQETMQKDIQYLIDHDNTRTECFSSMITLINIMQWQRKMLQSVFEKLHDLKANL